MPEGPTATQPAASARRALDRSLAAGLAWTGLAKWGAQLVSWASTLIVARLLTPTDYGIVGMATVYLGLVQLVSEFGLGAAIVQQRDLKAPQVAGLGGLAVLVGLVLFGLSTAFAPVIAGFFGEPRVRAVVLTLAAMFVVTAFQVVPNSLLARDLAFKRLAFIEGLESVTQVVVTLGLAIAGAGYWALVLGGVCGKTVSTVVMNRARPHALAWPRELGPLRDAVIFGWRVVITRLTWYVYSNADFAIIGRVLGTASLGSYTVGRDLASIPVDRVSAVLGRVAMPVLSTVQGDRAAVARYLMLLSEGLAFLVLPASIGLALVASDFVPVVLGPQWTAAIIPLVVLSAHVSVRCVGSLFSQALLALGETRQSVRIGMVQLLVLPALFYAAARGWGVNAVAFTWLVVHPLITLPMLFGFTLRRVGTGPRELFRVLWPAISSTLVMVAVVLTLKHTLLGFNQVGRLALCVATGAAGYGLTLVTFHRARLRHLLAAARELRQR